MILKKKEKKKKPHLKRATTKSPFDVIVLEAVSHPAVSRSKGLVAFLHGVYLEILSTIIKDLSYFYVFFSTWNECRLS